MAESTMQKTRSDHVFDLTCFPFLFPSYCTVYLLSWLVHFQFLGSVSLPALFSSLPLELNFCFKTIIIFRNNKERANRPFPSSFVPLFQNESKCETFDMKMSSACSFILMQIKVIIIETEPHVCIEIGTHATIFSWSTWLATWITGACAQ